MTKTYVALELCLLASDTRIAKLGNANELDLWKSAVRCLYTDQYERFWQSSSTLRRDRSRLVRCHLET